MENSLNNRQIFKTLGLASLLLVCGLGIARLQQPKLQVLSGSDLDTRDYEQEINKQDIKVNLLKNLPAFGFDNLFADWGMLQFIQYYGDEEARTQTGYHLSPDYLEIIVNNDPRFTLAYMIISPASSINAGRPDRTVSLMDRGLKSLTPDIAKAYYVWLYKGVDELLFLGYIPEAKKSYSMAEDWANRAGNEFITSLARDTVQFLSTKPDSRKAQVGAWFMVYANVPDKETKALAKRNIERLGGKLIFHENGRVQAIAPKND